MLIIKFICNLLLIPYTYLAINQGLDSDFGVYVQMYENFEYSDYQNQILMGLIFWFGNVLNINVYFYFFCILYLLISLLINKTFSSLVISQINKIFIVVFLLLFLTYIQSPIMYGHLMRQNVATIIFLLLLLRGRYWLSSILASLIHLSILPIFLINGIQSSLKINYNKKINIIIVLIIILVVNIINSKLENIIQIQPTFGIFWIDNFFSVYSVYDDPYGNLIGLRLFLIVTFIFGAKFLDLNKFVERKLYFSLISCLLLSAILSFSEVLSYRFLISAKYISFCIVIFCIAKFNFILKIKK